MGKKEGRRGESGNRKQKQEGEQRQRGGFRKLVQLCHGTPYWPSWRNPKRAPPLGAAQGQCTFSPPKSMHVCSSLHTEGIEKTFSTSKPHPQTCATWEKELWHLSSVTTWKVHQLCLDVPGVYGAQPAQFPIGSGNEQGRGTCLGLGLVKFQCSIHKDETEGLEVSIRSFETSKKLLSTQQATINEISSHTNQEGYNQRLTILNVGEDVDQLNFHTLLVRVQNGTTTLENCLAACNVIPFIGLYS